MDANLLSGILDSLEPINLLWILVGVSLGTLFGALPGIGPATGMALLLPLMFGVDPLTSLLLLVGIYQGAMYGGRISSILINVPGDAGAVVSTFDGYPLTQQGKAGLALSLSAMASFIGGIAGFLGLAFLSKLMADVAVKFGPPEYFSLMLFALFAAGGITGKRPLKAIISVVLGLLIAMVGVDFVSGERRLTFGVTDLFEGIGFIPLAIGIFGLSEVLVTIEKGPLKGLENKGGKISPFPKLTETIQNFGSMIRGSIIGFFVGVLPGAGSTIATFLSYSAEKKVSKHPEKFGTGVTQGLAGPEAANNSSVGGALVPLFALGIPGSGTTAILLGGLMMIGLNPGPRFFENSPDIVWGVIGSLLIANILLLFMNTLMVPVFVAMIEKVQPYLVPFITALCLIGVYVTNYRLFEVGLMIIAGVFGYFFRKLGFPLAPLILAVILGETIETSLRQSMLMSNTGWAILFTRPVSGVLLILTIIIIAMPLLRKIPLFKK